MTSENILTRHFFRKKKIRYIAFFLPLLLLDQSVIGKDTTHKQDQTTLNVEIKDAGAFKPWFQKDFYKKHLKDPNYRHGHPDIAEKIFLDHKYTLLRTQQIQDLILIALRVLGAILVVVGLDYMHGKKFFNDYVADKAISVMVNPFSLAALKLFYKKGCTRGPLSEYVEVTDWGQTGNNKALKTGTTIALKRFIINLLTASILWYVVPYKKGLLSLLCIFSPLIAIPATVLAAIHGALYSHIIPLVKYWREGKVYQLADDMQEAEILYIRNQHRMSKEMQDFLEDKLLQARKYPAKRAGLTEWMQNIVALPTLEEASKGITIEGDIDISLMADYEDNIQDQVQRLYYSYVQGIKIHYTYLVGPPGVGKTHLIKLFGKALDANVAEVSFAGARAQDIIGYPPQDGKPGYIGRITEAIQRASIKDKKPVILFVDEIDKALQGPYKEEINALCLELFESNAKAFSNPYLNGMPIPLPIVVVFAGNGEITGPFGNRLDVVHANGYTWEGKRNIIYGRYSPEANAPVGNLDKYCEDVNIKREDLTEEDYRAIENRLKEMEKEEESLPKEERDPGMRKIEIEILEYLFRENMKEDFQKLKAQLEELKKKRPEVKAF